MFKEPSITLGQDLIKFIAEIDEFKGKWQVLQNLSPDHLSALKKVATIESIASSTRIEGSKLTNIEVETLLSNLRSTSFKTRDEQEVVGYAEAMDIIFQSYEEMRLTENHIKQLHQILLKHSHKDERHRGAYKTLDNHVVAYDADGIEIGIVFETSTPFNTPRKMEDLVHWVNKAITEESMHPLLIVAIFIVVFLAIHPFQDGNGRLSRIITTLMLLRAGYAYVPYSSMERVVEDNKDLYYKALRRTQTTLKNEKPDWESWIGFFLRCLKKQKDVLAKRLQQETIISQDDSNLPELSLKILALLNEHSRLTIAQIVEHTGAVQSTLKVRLRELVNAERIKRHGKARATWYSRK
jgi:Fic family protein